jgi:hypothetical protein
MNPAWYRMRLLALLSAATTLTGCSREEAPQTASHPRVEALEQPFRPNAGIQDLMVAMIDPAADFLWDSVSTISNENGVEEKQPRTDEEWHEVRRQAIIVAEASNLLMMEGRRVAKEGKLLEDHGTPGNLSAEEAEKAIATDRASFVSFAQAMHAVGETMVAAADAKNVQALFDAGDKLDQVCEGCHLKFWYPQQKAPRP